MDNRNSSLVFIIFFFIRLLFQKRQACGPTLFILDISGFPDSTDVSLYADNFVYAALNNGHGRTTLSEQYWLSAWMALRKQDAGQYYRMWNESFQQQKQLVTFHKIGDHLMNHVDDINSAVKSQV